MKYLSLLLIFALLCQGCAHAHLSLEEKCAMNDMVLVGAQGGDANCRIPQGETERSVVQATKTAATKKEDDAREAGAHNRRWWIGAGITAVCLLFLAHVVSGANSPAPTYH